ncbi:MAG: hypothetical protein R6U68_02105 [Desulfobacteraceae bacterium]
MKKKILIRMVLIGALHGTLYLWLVPFVICPKLGHNGFILTAAIAVVVSIALIGTLFVGKNK